MWCLTDLGFSSRFLSTAANQGCKGMRVAAHARNAVLSRFNQSSSRAAKRVQQQITVTEAKRGDVLADEVRRIGKDEPVTSSWIGISSLCRALIAPFRGFARFATGCCICLKRDSSRFLASRQESFLATPEANRVRPNPAFASSRLNFACRHAGSSLLPARHSIPRPARTFNFPRTANCHSLPGRYPRRSGCSRTFCR